MDGDLCSHTGFLVGAAAAAAFHACLCPERFSDETNYLKKRWTVCVPLYQTICRGGWGYVAVGEVDTIRKEPRSDRKSTRLNSSH